MSMVTPFDWTPHLQAGERLLWTGQPEFAGLLSFVLFGCLALVVVPHGFVVLLFPLGLAAMFARDAYALTDHRVLAHRHPFSQTPRLDSLPRAGTYAGPLLGKGPRSVVFTAPDRAKITFRFLSRATQKYLIAEYPKGGPFPAEGVAR